MFQFSCARPTYSKVMVSGLVANLTNAGFAAVGAGAGYVIGKTQGDTRTGVLGAMLGGGVGLIAGVLPAMLVQRRMIRSPECTNPSLGRLFGYRMATMAAMVPVAAAAKAVLPDTCTPDPAAAAAGNTLKCKTNPTRQVLLSSVATFGMPLLGVPLLKE